MSREASKAKPSTNWDRLQQMEDAVVDVSEISPLDATFFRDATLRLPKNKKAVSIRLDRDVLDWFKQQGKGYQTRINAVLRLYMEAKNAERLR